MSGGARRARQGHGAELAQEPGQLTRGTRQVKIQRHSPHRPPRIEEANNGGGLDCDHHTGAGCTNPPPGAFYPWFHLLPVNNLAGRHCAWALSNDIPGQLSNFGGEKAGWGPLELTNYGFDLRYHNFARIIKNPCR